MASMKTTVDLPDELLIAAKKQAAEERTSLREILARSLRRELSSAGVGRESPKTIAWAVVDGGLPEGLDVSSRSAMYDWIDDEP